MHKTFYNISMGQVPLPLPMPGCVYNYSAEDCNNSAVLYIPGGGAAVAIVLRPSQSQALYRYTAVQNKQNLTVIAKNFYHSS